MIGLMVWSLVGLLAAICFVGIGVRSLRDFSHHDMEELCKRRNREKRLDEILRGHDRVESSLDMLQTLFTAAFIVFFVVFTFDRIDESLQQRTSTIVACSAIGLLLLLALGTWIPMAVSRLWSEQILESTWPFWSVVRSLMSPFELCSRFVVVLAHRLAGRIPEEPGEESFEDEIRSMVTEGHREGLLEKDARGMIEGVIELSDVDVSEVMTPRTEMKSLHVGLDWQDMLEFVIECGHTRIPVFDKNRDDIIGILIIKDLLREFAKSTDEAKRPWAEIMREPRFLPESKPIDDLLQDFQHTGNHIAIVLDEYGGVSGLVTIEDVLEEIVGEIIDEYDEDLVEEITKIDDHTFESLARVHVDEINDLLSVDLPDSDDYDTIGGFVFSQLGKIPPEGEQITWHSIRITVLEVTRRRIEKVRLELLDESQRESA